MLIHLAKDCLTWGVGDGNNAKIISDLLSSLSLILDPFKQTILARKVPSLS